MRHEIWCDYGDRGYCVMRYARDAAEAERIARQCEEHDERVTQCYGGELPAKISRWRQLTFFKEIKCHNTTSAVI